MKTNVVEKNTSADLNHNKDTVYSQEIVAKIMNGKYKGRLIHLENTYSYSGAYDQKYTVGTALFVSLEKNSQHALSGTIEGVKRDTQVTAVAGLFILILLAIGRKQGFYSIISLFINIVLLIGALNVYLALGNVSLLAVCIVAVVLFTVISLLLVSGNQEKTHVAIISTLIGTFVSLLIAYIVMQLTDSNGLHYEGMEFVTIPPQKIFMSEVLIGSLGAVMDVAITITSSVYELYEKNKEIAHKDLLKSGKEIGGDIMGAMTNILFFSYISGTIPMVLLYLKNGSPLGYTFSMNFSLELIRALTGSIGIVLTIPLTLYLSILFIFRKGNRK
ncbi:YibE/F family protein [Priestia megaterium]|uniref:YibE/F family protein n=1 Tax=Priestia megaterium TaxID=1404 RepID=UPI00101C8950|nr:YibE/F family protein [Priestia megaterium]